MSSSTAGRARRGTARLAASALAVAGLAAVGATTTAAPAQAADSFVSDATLTWGLSGYAQKGIFGPWTFKDLTGNVTQLVGSVSGGSQTEYVVGAVPATSMPASSPQKTPNAVKFSAGTGTADPATDETSISWTGSYTVNAYPAIYGAPDEIYSNPQLVLDDSGDGALTMNFALGAGQDMSGNPTEAQDFGRITLLEFDAGDVVSTGADSFRATPNYQGVTVTVPADGSAQTTSCSTDSGATGWWGSWPQQLITAIPASVRPHFYSTGCGGMQDNKPPLPVDVDLGTVTTPTVTVSDVTLLPNGTQAVTVSGTGFDPTKAIGTRPPFSGKQSGVYVAFGRYADVWRPSTGAASSTRNNPASPNGNGVAVKWAVPQASFEGSGQDPTAAAYTILGTDGTFSTTIQVDQSWLADKAGNFGIYTYTGGGATVAAYETYTPVTFAKATPTVTLTAAPVAEGAPATAKVTVASEGGTTGTVTITEGGTTLGSVTDVVDGVATVDLGSALSVGSHQLTASYSGNDNTEAGTATATLIVAAPSVQVSKTTLLPHGTQQVTVTGTGFNPAAAIGTRPPFSGKQSGFYIAFGRYADVWRPSAGATSSSRNNPAGANGNGVGVKWAVPQASFEGSGQDPTNAAYTILGTDGSFSTTISVDQSWLADKSGNFGIYTYAAGGATVAAFETYTPITFAKATPTVTLDTADVTAGSPASATVTVASEGGATGSVTLTDGGTEVGTLDLVDGMASFDLGSALSVGSHALTASYAGNDNTETGTAEATLVVSKAAATVAISAPGRVYGQSASATVTVAGATGGSVTLTRGSTPVGTVAITSGTAVFDLGELPAGTHALAASYSGTDTVEAATASATVTVTKAASRTAVKLVKKPTSKKAGKAQVTVTTVPAGSAAGTVKLVLRTRAGKLVKQVAAKVNARGIASTALPKVAKGTYQLVVTYAGTANVKGSSKTVSVKVA